ncbi:MAG: hypothetical protein GY756_17840 [bacterium]|nr:hypothetical protein [bacterium]
MNTEEDTFNGNTTPLSEILLKQYEQSWKQIEHLDKSYTQTTLIYIALIGAYIGSFDKIAGNSFLISSCLILISGCILGALLRIRKLIDQEFVVISKIEKSYSMIEKTGIDGLGNIRTSTYLGIIVVIMTILAVVLTLSK